MRPGRSGSQEDVGPARRSAVRRMGRRTDGTSVAAPPGPPVGEVGVAARPDGGAERGAAPAQGSPLADIGGRRPARSRCRPLRTGCGPVVYGLRSGRLESNVQSAGAHGGLPGTAGARPLQRGDTGGSRSAAPHSSGPPTEPGGDLGGRPARGVPTVPRGLLPFRAGGLEARMALCSRDSSDASRARLHSDHSARIGQLPAPGRSRCGSRTRNARPTRPRRRSGREARARQRAPG
jgi:hypothetical protein